MIELIDVHKELAGRSILRGLSLRVDQGENFVLMGRSGTGKSVTLKHVIGIFKPDRGRVIVDEFDVPHLNKKDLQKLRREMGYLFQNGALINWLTVADNVALPLREHSDMSKKDVRAEAMRVLELVGMAKAANLYPSSISGGMRLRTGLARALITQPRYVLYDEPNAGLDPIMSDQIHQLIVKTRDELGVTGLVVTHSRACATTVGNRIGVIDEGRMVESGSLAEMLRSETPIVRDFLGGGAD